jgi:hypothetical protein
VTRPEQMPLSIRFGGGCRESRSSHPWKRTVEHSNDEPQSPILIVNATDKIPHFQKNTGQNCAAAASIKASCNRASSVVDSATALYGTYFGFFDRLPSSIASLVSGDSKYTGTEP